MNIRTAKTEPASTSPVTDREMLDKLYRELVSIHASMEEATHDNKTIIPWAKRELMGVIRDLGAFRREHRDASEAALRT